jgi:hypothetical protein
VCKMLGYENAYREHDQSRRPPEPSPAEYESPMDAKFCIHGNLVALPNDMCSVYAREPADDEVAGMCMLGTISFTKG